MSEEIFFLMIKKKKINKAFSERHKKLYEIQILMSVNKTLLKHSHAYSFTYCPWQLPNHSGEVFHQRLMAHKASTVYDLALHRKNVGQGSSLSAQASLRVKPTQEEEELGRVTCYGLV